MSLQGEVGRGVYNVIELIANQTAGELLEAHGQGTINCDVETIRSIAALVKASVMKQAGTSAEAVSNIVSSS